MPASPERSAAAPPVGAPVPGWKARPAPAPALLAGRYVRVVPLSSAHYADVHAATCGPDDDALWTYRPIPRPTSLADLWMHLAAAVDAPGDLVFALVPTEGEHAGTATGVASYLRVVPEHGRIEIGSILLGRSLQRTRAATEAIHLLMRHALDDLGYRRLEWKCDALNEPSRRAAVRYGFVHEGRFRNDLVVQGRNRDTDWYSVTAEEWPRLRAAHEQWLDPDNFDDDGRQRARLAVPGDDVTRP